MHENKTFNRNPTNYTLYHALIEALIKDENAMDKGVSDMVKDHKRKHDGDDDDDDDEDPSARQNQGKTTKRRRTKESESAKKPSITKETFKGKGPMKGSKTATNTKGEDVVLNDDQPQDSSAPKTDKTDRQTWFEQPPRPPTPDPEWNKRQYVLNRLKIDNLTQDILLGPAFNLLKGESPYLTIAADYFFNNDLEYLKSSDPTRNYTTSITKTKAAHYKIKGIEDMLNKFSRDNVDLTQKILSVVSVKVERLHGYGYLKEIVVKRADRQLHKFKEGDFVNLYLNDIEDMLLLAVQHSYQKKLNITAPQKTFPRIEFKELYTPSGDPSGIVYEDLDKQPRVMRADELYKFLDGTLKAVCDELHHKILDFCLGYNTEMPLIKWTDTNKRRSELMVEMIDKLMLERRIIRTLERLVGA
ncbi:hypothetical protein Tco_0138240 [Tanacetum coccineum]